MTSLSLDPEEYRVLADFRYTLRRFLRFSEDAADSIGLTPQQHQALLFIKAYQASKPVSVGDLAEWLMVKSHSAAEMTLRLQNSGLLARRSDPGDRRRTLLELTAAGEEVLHRLIGVHMQEYQQLQGPLQEMLQLIDRNLSHV